jgi:histone-lysine N-methyltransferase SETD3
VGQDFLITVETAKAHPLCQRFAASGLERELSASKHCYLSVFLLCLRSEGLASAFAPYVAALPQSYPNMPIFWAPEELRWLSGSALLEQVEDRRRNIRCDYELLCSAVPELGEAFSLLDFAWARMAVASRNFGIVVDGVRTDALVPYADMLNHLRPRQTRWLFDSSRKAFLIISMHALTAGQQVCDSYGKKCNSRFLLNYGFAVEHNHDEDTGQCHNEVRLQLALLTPKEDPWHWKKAECLGSM